MIAWGLRIVTVGNVISPDRILQSYVILLLVLISFCSISSPWVAAGLCEGSGLHYDFAQPCNPILVPIVLPPIVLPGFVWLCMDCRIDIGLPKHCNTILILQPFVLIGFLGLCKDWRVEVGFCHSWLGFMFSSSIIPGCMNWSYSVMIVRNCAITF